MSSGPPARPTRSDSAAGTRSGSARRPQHDPGAWRMIPRSRATATATETTAHSTPRARRASGTRRRIARRLGDEDRAQQGLSPEHRPTRTGEEIGQRQGSHAGAGVDAHQGVERQERRRGVGGRRGVAQVAAERSAVSHLRRGHRRDRLGQDRQQPAQLRVVLDVAQPSEGADDDPPVALDLDSSAQDGDALDVDDRVGHPLAGAHLDQHVGAAGEERGAPPIRRQEAERLGHVPRDDVLERRQRGAEHAPSGGDKGTMGRTGFHANLPSPGWAAPDGPHSAARRCGLQDEVRGVRQERRVRGRGAGAGTEGPMDPEGPRCAGRSFPPAGDRRYAGSDA